MNEVAMHFPYATSNDWRTLATDPSDMPPISDETTRLTYNALI